MVQASLVATMIFSLAALVLTLTLGLGLALHLERDSRWNVATRAAALVPYVGASRVYATSRVDNEPMHATLNRFGFKSVGVPYALKQNDTPIQLFVRA